MRAGAGGGKNQGRSEKETWNSNRTPGACSCGVQPVAPQEEHSRRACGNVSFDCCQQI